MRIVRKQAGNIFLFALPMRHKLRRNVAIGHIQSGRYSTKTKFSDCALGFVSYQHTFSGAKGDR